MSIFQGASSGTREQELRDALKESQTVIEDLNEEFARIAESALAPATVLSFVDGRAIVARNGDVLAIRIPKKVQLEVGDPILLTRDSAQYVDRAEVQATGEVCVISRELDDETVEVTVNSSPIAVLRGSLGELLKEGDRVILDKSKSIVIQYFEGSDQRFDFTAETNVSWDDIGGQEQAKKELIEAIELPRKHPEIFKFYGKKPIKGVLLEGPPGCGKTMLAKAVATSIGGDSSGFLYVKGAEVLDPYVGVAEATIRSLFARSREYKEATGSPAVIFIDEADALLGSRSGHNANMEKTIVPTFLAEMDGLEDSGAVVILATNRADSLDPAVTREGRMDRKVQVRRPEKTDAATILEMYLSKLPIASSSNREELVSAACDAIYDPSRAYYDVHMDNGAVRTFGLAHLSSGAMLAGIVDQASSLALHRDLATGSQPSGVGMDDMYSAIDKIYLQNANVDHSDALVHFAGNATITQVKKRSECYAKAA